jgi:predicted secreted hydrolase
VQALNLFASGSKTGRCKASSTSSSRCGFARATEILQGDKGFSRKSAEAGNASYYYSFSRLDTHGTIERRRERRGVVGTSWMDREWSTSALSPEQMGWDWFALQFADGRDLMYYNLRRRDGSSSPYSRGTLVDAAGTAIPLSNRDVELQPLETWTSADSGVRYPIGWRISVPDQGLDTRVEALIADQEVDLSVRYWEGAVRSRSELGEGEPVTGYGYMELTGYGEQ